MSFGAMPCAFRVSTIARMAVELAASASRALAASLITPRLMWAISGSAVTEAWPMTAMVRSAVMTTPQSWALARAIAAEASATESSADTRTRTIMSAILAADLRVARRGVGQVARTASPKASNSARLIGIGLRIVLGVPLHAEREARRSAMRIASMVPSSATPSTTMRLPGSRMPCPCSEFTRIVSRP